MSQQILNNVVHICYETKIMCPDQGCQNKIIFISFYILNRYSMSEMSYDQFFSCIIRKILDLKNLSVIPISKLPTQSTTNMGHW